MRASRLMFASWVKLGPFLSRNENERRGEGALDANL